MLNNKLTLARMMNFKKHSVIFLYFLGCFSLQLTAQNFDKSRGLSFLHNYLPEAYHAHEKNFDIIQAQDGIMYFANFAGILKFDGSNWTKIVSASGMRIISLAKDDENRIYAGGLYDFGYLLTDNKGVTKFNSLLNDKEDLKKSGLIFKVICQGKNTYFISDKQMFVYDGKKLEIVAFKNQVLKAFEADNRIYLFFNTENEKADFAGLYTYTQDKLDKISVKEDSPLQDICFIIPAINRKELIIGTSNQGLFVLKGKEVSEMYAPVNDFLKKNRLISGIKVNNSLYALSTSVGGVVLINKEGKIIQIIDQLSGLNNESVNALFLDKTSSLWIATDNGISKSEINWPLSYIDNKTSGLEGKVEDMESFNKKMYFATDKGLFFLEGSNIHKINNLNAACLSLLKTQENLYVASSRGIYKIDFNNSPKLVTEQFTFCLTQSSVNKNIIYAGHSKSVNVFEQTGNSLKLKNSIEDLKGDVVNILEDNEGDLYFEVSPGKIFVYNPLNKKLNEIGKESDFLSLHLGKKGNTIYLSSEKGLYLINKESAKLSPFFLAPNDSVSQKIWMHHLYELSDNQYIFTNGEQKQLSFLNLNENKLTFNQTPFSLLPIFLFRTFGSILKTTKYGQAEKTVLLFQVKKIYSIIQLISIP